MEKGINDLDYVKYKVRDEDTGEFIPHISYANDETGEYDEFVKDKEGRWQLSETGVGVKTVRKKGNIKLVKVYD